MADYITRAEGDTYFSNRLNTDVWDDAVDGDQNAAINESTLAIDRLNFIGNKEVATQVNQFPRGSDTVVPQDIKDACAEEAIRRLDGVSEEEEYEGLRIQKNQYADVNINEDVGMVPRHIIAGIMSIKAWRLLLPFIRDPHSMALSRVN